MKRTGCPARSCPLELRAKGAGVQYGHRFDHTCRIVSFPVGKRYDFGFADSRAFCFLHGEGAPYPAYACMEILNGASPAPVCVSHRLCVIPRRGPGPKQVFFSHTGPRRPRRTLPQPAPESGCPRRPRPLRRTGAGPRARTVRDPNRFFPPAQVCAGPQDPSAPRPRGCCPRGPHPLRNGRAFAPNRYGSPGPDRLDPVPPFSLCAAPFVTVFFSRCGLIFPACLIDGRKIAAEKFPPPSRFSSIYVRTGYKTQ